jgi:hypothetical protein
MRLFLLELPFLVSLPSFFLLQLLLWRQSRLAWLFHFVCVLNWLARHRMRLRLDLVRAGNLWLLRLWFRPAHLALVLGWEISSGMRLWLELRSNRAGRLSWLIG